MCSWDFDLRDRDKAFKEMGRACRNLVTVTRNYTSYLLETKERKGNRNKFGTGYSQILNGSALRVKEFGFYLI